jgi:hypothetical protein
MRDTSRVGNVTVAKVLLALVVKGKNVLTPFGEGERYDLMIDEGRSVVRVQCKTGRLRKGSVIFNNYSQTAAGWKKYKDSVDAYGVFCPQNQKTYLVPVKVCASGKTALRVEPAKNGMTKNIRYAERFEV